MYPLLKWFVSGIYVWIPCIKETMVMIIIIIVVVVKIIRNGGRGLVELESAYNGAIVGHSEYVNQNTVRLT